MLTFIILTLLAALSLALPMVPRGTGYTSGSTANDVNDGVCAPLTVIFARGTGEGGNIGALTGPQLFSQLSSKLGGSVALQGVDYPADWFGNFQQGSSGSPSLVSLVKKATKQCPSTNVVISGYSQGAMVVHYALNQGGLPSDKIHGVVYFGDPEDGITASGQVPSSWIKSYCNKGDGVCEQHGFYITEPHLQYAASASDAANFIISAAVS